VTDDTIYTNMSHKAFVVPDSIGHRRHGHPAQRGAIIGAAFFGYFFGGAKK
jgi:hypothetical protein